METNSTIPALALSIADSCKVLSIGRTRLYALIGEGKIQARACGGRTLIVADSLRVFLETLPPAPIGGKRAA